MTKEELPALWRSGATAMVYPRHYSRIQAARGGEAMACWDAGDHVESTPALKAAGAHAAVLVDPLSVKELTEAMTPAGQGGSSARRPGDCPGEELSTGGGFLLEERSAESTLDAYRRSSRSPLLGQEGWPCHQEECRREASWQRRASRTGLVILD